MATSQQSATPASARRRPRSAAPKKRYGCEQPRVFTPPRAELTRQTSLGFECVDFAESALGLSLLPWQRWLLIHALELNDDGNFRFRKVLLLVGRQNGKSTVVQALTLWRMYVDRCALVLGTAQDLEVAEALWSESVDMAEETEDLAAEIAKVEKGSGRKRLVLRTGETYKVKAATRRGGRGLSGELVLLDELREHQSWDAWAAVTKTTNAKERAQIWGISNAGDTTSVVARYLRKLAHNALGNPDRLPEIEEQPADEVAEDDELTDGDSLGLFEWSAPKGCEITDRDGWAQANPALGYLIREDTIAGDARTDPEWVFRAEVLCQWSEGSSEGPFPTGAWEATEDGASAPSPDSPLVVGLDVSWDRSAAYLAVAGWRADGLAHVEIVQARYGTEWVIAWLTDAERDVALAHAPVVVQTNGAPASSLIDGLVEAGVRVLDWKGADLGAACGQFYDRVRAAVGQGVSESSLRHRPQPVLDRAAATAVPKPAGDAWLWDRRKSPYDVAPLTAVTGALWGLDRPAETPASSAYDNGARLTVL